MARGTPDWWRGFDPFGTGVRLSVRPAYGGAIKADLAKVLPFGTLTSIIKVEGQGIIHGGYLWVDIGQSHKGDWVLLHIDDELFGEGNFENVNMFNHDLPFSDVLWLSVYDEVNFKYCMNITPGYTFEESFELKYNNKHASQAVALVGFVYYSVAP